MSVTGITSAVDAIKAADLEMTVDVGAAIGDEDGTDFAGRYRAQVTVTAPDGVTVNNVITAVIQITSENKETETE